MDDKYAGMTVNERLFVSGLMDKFDDAVEKKDVTVIRSILREVELTDPAIDEIIQKLIAH